MNPAFVVLFSFRCVTHLYVLFAYHQYSSSSFSITVPLFLALEISSLAKNFQHILFNYTAEDNTVIAFAAGLQ